MSAKRRAYWPVRVIGLAMVMALAVAPVAHAAVPSTPTIRDAWVSAIGKVSVRWDASVDASGHAVGYDVYRDVVPITSATIVSRSLTPVIANYLGTTVQVNAASAETPQSYSWFYAVVARDDQAIPLRSGPSGNMAPNLHGYRNDPAVVSCGRCHQVHGAYLYDYRTNDLCYTCHGSTSAAAGIGAKSTYNVQADFADYSGQTLGSRHRNQYMIDNKTECTACHSSHRISYFYDTSGVYQASSSYRMMLRVRYGTSTYNYYSKNSAPATNNEFCLSCHGSTVVFDGKTVDAATSIALAGGPSAFANTGGDHNTAGYAASAHGQTNVYSNDYPATNPAVQCEVCHDNHGSATTRLIDYRRSGTTDPNANKQANLCFKCHSASSTETKVAAGLVKPFSWNGRDVQAEFNRVSRHPTTIVAGSMVPTVHNTFSNTTKAQFDTYTLSNTVTTDTAGGEIVLAQYASYYTPPTRPVIYGSRGGVATFSSYDTTGTTWDTAPADNARFSPASGSSAFYVNGRVYVTRGGGNATQAWYDPSTNAWCSLAQLTTLSENVGAGGDSTVNTNDTVTYYTAAGGANPRIMWWDYTGTATGEFNFQVGGADQNLGVGSAIAYAPGADRLFVIYQNGTAGDGRLYYLSDPARSVVDADFTQGPLTTSDTSSRYARMTYFMKGGTEYLFVHGRDTGDTRDGIVISSLSGTPVKTDTNVDPFGGTSTGDGCSLQWDGGDYLYAFVGGGSTAYRRALIPADPVAGPWTWSALATSFNQDAGSSIAVAQYQPADIQTMLYQTLGTATTPDILPFSSANTWGTVSLTKNTPANTDLKVSVLGWNGSGWDTLVDQSGAASIDISGYTTATYPKLQLRAHLSNTNDQATPWLLDWAVTSLYGVYTTPSGSLTCASCHNVHYNKAETASGVWDLDRASDPDNTKNTVTSTTFGSAASDFCMRCHDGAGPTATTTTTTVVPYNVGFSSVTAPYFPGWNKEGGTNLKFSESGHRTASLANGQALCETCHDPHASNNKRLGAWTRPAGVTWLGTGAPSVAGSRVNTGTAASEQNLCYKCHGDGTASYPQSAGAKNVYTKANLTYAHDPGDDSGAHADTETAALLGGTNRHAECADCHDPHVAKKVSGSALALHNGTSSVAGSAVYGAWGTGVTYPTANWGAPSAYTPTRLAGGTGAYEAYLCFKCHSGNTAFPGTQTNVAQEFNPSNASYHNVLGQSLGMQTDFTVPDSGGTTQTVTWALPTRSFFLGTWNSNSKMTCTDCHTNNLNAATEASGPHGSSAAWLIDPDYATDWKTAYVSNGSTLGMSSATIICAKCHDLNGPGSTTNWTNNVHSQGDHQGATAGKCVLCHIKVPHGWKRPRLLVNVDRDGVYSGSTVGTTYFTVSSHSVNGSMVNWSKSDCATDCGEHSTSLTTYWP